MNSERVINALSSTKVGICEWQFKENKLSLSAGVFLLLNESINSNFLTFQYLWKRIDSFDRKNIVKSITRSIKTDNDFDIDIYIKNIHQKKIHVQVHGGISKDALGNPEYLTATMMNKVANSSIVNLHQPSHIEEANSFEFPHAGLWSVISKQQLETSSDIWFSDSLWQALGYKEDQSKNTDFSFSKLLHSTDLRLIRFISIKQIEQTILPIDLVLRIKNKGGEFTWIHFLGYKKRLPSGLFESKGLALSIDCLKLSEQKNKLENRVHLQRINCLEHFVYSASHDLNAPLRGIKNLLEWIEEDLIGCNEGVKHNMSLMSNRVIRMERLISDILAYSLAGQRYYRYPYEKIDLRNTLNRIWESTESKGDFNLVLKLESSSIYAPKTLIEQTFSNLISNAIKHHHRSSGQVGICYEITNGKHWFSVSDDGPGIPPDSEMKVFQIFQTLKPKDDQEGSGLGLSIVKRSIEASQGAIWLSKKPKKTGACFCFTIPVIKPASIY